MSGREPRLGDRGGRHTGPCAIVIGSGPNALAHARALRSAGVRVIGCTPRGQDGLLRFSRGVRHVWLPSPVGNAEDALEALEAVAASCAARPVAYVTDDDWVELLTDQRARVDAVADVPLASPPVIAGIADKLSLYGLAAQLGVPTPWTQPFESLGCLAEAVADLPMPCIVKPRATAGFAETLRRCGVPSWGHRVRAFESRAELRAWLAQLDDHGVDAGMLAQEFIPGTCEALYTLTSYSSREAKVVVGSIGHKVRQYPPDAGCIVAGRLRHVPEIAEIGRRLLDGVQFTGLANTEFKYDPRDGLYKLMEINPRLGKWNGSALAAGLNLPLIALRDLQGRPYEGPMFTRSADGLLWIDLLEDALDEFVRYRAGGYATARLGLASWLRSVRGRKARAVWSWLDPLPSVTLIGQFARSAMRRTRSDAPQPPAQAPTGAER